MSVKMRMRVERAIARRFVLDALAAGYTINVDNGDGYELPMSSSSPKKILETMFATDEEDLIIFRKGKLYGWVQFIHGNGPDVISDYSTNLEPIMGGASELADKYSD